MFSRQTQYLFEHFIRQYSHIICSQMAHKPIPSVLCNGLMAQLAQ